MNQPAASALGVVHRRRLRQIWRSAGWPCQDSIEIELLAAGLLERCSPAGVRESLRLSDSGIQMLAETLRGNRALRDRHESLVARVASQLQCGGRIAWRGLSLRAAVADTERAEGRRWQIAMPDVFSVRNTTVAVYLQSAVHEIKVRRADLLADLRRADKRAAYLAMAGECWYVLAEGIAEPDEVPRECGVMLARGPEFSTLEVARAAPVRAMPFEAGLPFAVWMALAVAAPVPRPDDDGQRWLGQPTDQGEPPT